MHSLWDNVLFPLSWSISSIQKMSDYFNKYDKVRYFYCFFINFHRMIKSVNVLWSDVSQYPDILFPYLSISGNRGHFVLLLLFKSFHIFRDCERTHGSGDFSSRFCTAKRLLKWLCAYGEMINNVGVRAPRPTLLK